MRPKQSEDAFSAALVYLDIYPNDLKMQDSERHQRA